jgi:dolichol-phosphate mannosyltransferase
MDLHRPILSAKERINSIETFNVNIPAALALVVIPTYNERENIEAILTALDASLIKLDVLVVDDGSPDGTAEAVASVAKSKNRRVHLMRRSGKFGLGVAYLDAHRWILEQKQEYRFIIQMDADFSHDPSYIPALIAEADIHGIAVGSRYVPGGSAPDWSYRRLLISFAANMYLRTVLRMFFRSFGVHDNTSGFIAWRNDVLKIVLRYSVPGDGYSFLTSLKVIAHHVGYSPKEIPIVLQDRRLGVSKLDRRIIFEAIKMPWWLGLALQSSKLPDDLGKQQQDMHDNSLEMWNRYYASEDETGWFAAFVHWAREKYFGDVFARRVIRLGGIASSYLEVGVGTAQTLARLERRTGARCVGIEKTPSAHSLGVAYAERCQIVLGDGMHMPFRDAEFDIVYSLGLLEHFEPMEQAQLLLEQARVARCAVLVEVPVRSPHMRAILWFNRTVLNKKGVWADEELFSRKYFAVKYPGLPFEYKLDWASGFLTCWFKLLPEDIRLYVSREN